MKRVGPWITILLGVFQTLGSIGNFEWNNLATPAHPENGHYISKILLIDIFYINYYVFRLTHVAV